MVFTTSASVHPASARVAAMPSSTACVWPAMSGALAGAQPTAGANVRDVLAEEGAPENAE